MQGILKGYLLERPGPVIERDGRIDGFEIKKIEGVPEGI
jgi:hypothetical protein